VTNSVPAPPVPGEVEAERPHAGQIVGRGMMALVFSQFITTPVSMVVQAILARYLGAGDFGAIYFATTALAVWYLFVEWGGHAQVAAEVARDRLAAGRLFASGMLLRLAFASVVLAVIPAFARVMGYDGAIRLALYLVSMKLALQSLGALCLAVVRGFERVHWQARSTVFGNLMEAAIVIGVLLSGGGLKEALIAQIVASAITLAVQIGLVVRLRLGAWRPDWGTMAGIVKGGFSFLILDVVVRLQPYIDASFLSKLAPPEALGWYGAASRISGVLIFPALTLNYALYPTLARLWVSDRVTFDQLVRLGIRFVTIFGILAATGTVLFSSVVVDLVYGRAGYAPAAMNLAVMSVFILLVYFSIVLGPSLCAAGRQWQWCIAQSLCLIVSIVLDPILIPWAQRTYGNGGLGVCISIGVAEVAMVTSGLLILPRGIVNRAVAQTLMRCLTAAAAMVAVGLLLDNQPALAIPTTVATYVALLWLQGDFDSDLFTLFPAWVTNGVLRLQRRVR
jgi:O-antigen/teichoic acid export membrane protein